METGVPCRWGAKHENHALNKLIKAEILFYRLIRFFSDDGLAGSKRQPCSFFYRGTVKLLSCYTVTRDCIIIRVSGAISSISLKCQRTGTTELPQLQVRASRSTRSGTNYKVDSQIDPGACF